MASQKKPKHVTPVTDYDGCVIGSAYEGTQEYYDLLIRKAERDAKLKPRRRGGRRSVDEVAADGAQRERTAYSTEAPEIGASDRAVAAVEDLVRSRQVTRRRSQRDGTRADQPVGLGPLHRLARAEKQDGVSILDSVEQKKPKGPPPPPGPDASPEEMAAWREQYDPTSALFKQRVAAERRRKALEGQAQQGRRLFGRAPPISPFPAPPGGSFP